MDEPEFLTVDEVLLLHEAQLERWGGQPGVRDLGALSSAVMQAQATFDRAFLRALG